MKYVVHTRNGVSFEQKVTDTASVKECQDTVKTTIKTDRGLSVQQGTKAIFVPIEAIEYVEVIPEEEKKDKEAPEHKESKPAPR